MPSPLVKHSTPIRLLAATVCAHTVFISMRLALVLAILQQGAAAWMVGWIASLLMVVPVFSAIWIGR